MPTHSTPGAWEANSKMHRVIQRTTNRLSSELWLHTDGRKVHKEFNNLVHNVDRALAGALDINEMMQDPVKVKKEGGYNRMFDYLESQIEVLFRSYNELVGQYQKMPVRSQTIKLMEQKKLTLLKLYDTIDPTSDKASRRREKQRKAAVLKESLLALEELEAPEKLEAPKKPSRRARLINKFSTISKPSKK